MPVSHATASPLVLLALPLMAGCRTIDIPADPEPTGTPDLGPSATPQPEQPTALATPSGCSDLHGRVLAEELPMPGSLTPVGLPRLPSSVLQTQNQNSYPTLYLMHGLAQTEAEWVDLDIDAVADHLILDGIRTTVRDRDARRTNRLRHAGGRRGILLPYLEASLPTGGSPSFRTIGGLSSGGWALRIGAQRPDLFGAIGLHSPAVSARIFYLLRGWSGWSSPVLSLACGSTSAPVIRSSLPRHVNCGTCSRPPLALHLGSQPRGAHQQLLVEHLAEYLRWYGKGWPSSSRVDAWG